MHRIKVTVADLRRAPEELLPQTFAHNDGRESQLLRHEEVQILEEREGWLRVAAPEQLRSIGGDWHSYEGWVRQNEVEEGAPSTPKCTSFSRERVVAEAHTFLGAPYLWGGRSYPIEGMVASVDCSGLISLLYRSQGVLIPRDAHDQFLFGTPTDHLLPGDPLYLAKENRMNHVILKVSDTHYIEAPETGKKVRLLERGKEIWEEKGRLYYHDRPDSYAFYGISFA